MTAACKQHDNTLVETIAEALSDGKGEQVDILATEQQSGGLFTHIIIATAGSARHAAALASRVTKVRKGRIETSDEREWVLIDCGDVIVHIMQAEARERYRLEELWSFEEDNDT